MNEEPIYIVKVHGILRKEDLGLCRERFLEQLPGQVIMIDDTVEDIFKLEPQDGQTLVRMVAGIGGRMSTDPSNADMHMLIESLTWLGSAVRCVHQAVAEHGFYDDEDPVEMVDGIIENFYDNLACAKECANENTEQAERIKAYLGGPE